MVSCKVMYKVNQEDNSLVDLIINPEKDGTYYLHVFLGRTPLRPCMVTIVKSDLQMQQEHLAT